MWDKKWFGYWKQDGEHYKNCPDINEWIGSESLQPCEEILNYIEGGDLVAVSPINTVCHICNSTINSSKVICTDGEWQWAKDLSHYVSVHQLQLPDAFLEKMKKHGYVCPKVDEDFDPMNLEHP